MTLEFFHIPDWDLRPEDLKQIDLLSELPSGGGYGNIIAFVDVFSGSAFVCPFSNAPTVNTAKVIRDIMRRYAYLLTHIITYKGSVFVSQVIHEVVELIGINLKP